MCTTQQSILIFDNRLDCVWPLYILDAYEELVVVMEHVRTMCHCVKQIRVVYCLLIAMNAPRADSIRRKHLHIKEDKHSREAIDV